MNTDSILKNIAKHIELNNEEQNLFISVLNFKKVAHKKFILQEGEACNYIYYVHSGALRLLFIFLLKRKVFI